MNLKGSKSDLPKEDTSPTVIIESMNPLKYSIQLGHLGWIDEQGTARQVAYSFAIGRAIVRRDPSFQSANKDRNPGEAGEPNSAWARNCPSFTVVILQFRRGLCRVNLGGAFRRNRALLLVLVVVVVNASVFDLHRFRDLRSPSGCHESLSRRTFLRD